MNSKVGEQKTRQYETFSIFLHEKMCFKIASMTMETLVLAGQGNRLTITRHES